MRCYFCMARGNSAPWCPRPQKKDAAAPRLACTLTSGSLCAPGAIRASRRCAPSVPLKRLLQAAAPSGALEADTRRAPCDSVKQARQEAKARQRKGGDQGLALLYRIIAGRGLGLPLAETRPDSQPSIYPNAHHCALGNDAGWRSYSAYSVHRQAAG